MTVALLIHGLELPEGTRRCPESGLYIVSFKPEMHDGRGEFRTTKNIWRAAHFPDPGAALAFWRTRSVTVPNRPDGLPNRPLTAFTVEVVPVLDS